MIRPYLILMALGIVGVTTCIFTSAPKAKKIEETSEGVEKALSPTTPGTDSLQDLLNALIFVESRGIENAIGDTHLGEPSIGVLQIRPVMVAEVNRILKKQKNKKRFKLKDRFSREKSIEMFLIWKKYYHKDNNFEAIARSWNGGPRWRKIKRTNKYWAKVEKQLDEYKSS